MSLKFVAKVRIEELQEIARARGGNLLSSKYINSQTPLRWQCGVGHIWKATPANIKHMGSWCPKCRIRARVEEKTTKSLLSLKEAAAKKGLAVLTADENFKKLTQVVEFMCPLKHKFKLRANLIVSRKSAACPLCPRSSRSHKTTLDEIREMAKKGGYTLLSEGGSGLKTSYTFRCPKKHEFSKLGWDFKAGSGCPICQLERQRKTKKKSRLKSKPSQKPGIK